ncbi:MAG: hypothetical protein EP344_10825 [Bacteroidetes bacterium]|nr:MAG: hypothetical protein EP344_10825 [Bacteroidota bacterium]
MEEEAIIKQVKNLIGQGDLEEALKLLTTFSESNIKGGQANKVMNEIIHLKGQIADVKHAQNRGLIAFEEAERKQNRIRSSLLNLTDVVAGVEGAVLDAPATPQVAAGGSSNNVYKSIVIGVGAIVVFVIAILMFDSGEEPESSVQAGQMTGQDTEIVDGQECFFVTLHAVNVYAEADYNAVIVGSLPAEMDVVILDHKTVEDVNGDAIDYYLIASNNINGWVEHDDAIELDAATCY